MKYLISLYLLIGTFGSPALSQSETDEPMVAVVDSMKWLEYIEASHDVTVTIHKSTTLVMQGDGSRDSYEEAVLKCRHLVNQQSGEFQIPYGYGTVKIDMGRDNSEPREQSLTSVRYGAKDWIKELRRNERAIIFAPCPTTEKSCLEIACPLDFRTLSPCYPEVSYRDFNSDNASKMLDRFASLKLDKLVVQRLAVKSKKQVIYWITSDKPYANSIGQPATKLIVSDDGFDKGKVVEMHFGALKLDDDKKYTAESKLLPYATQVNYTWKEFEFKLESGESKKYVLPIAVSKKKNSYPYTSFLNATLEWNSIGQPISKELDLSYCQKLADEYSETVNKVLKR